MMHINNLKQYYFIDKFDYSHLINLDKNISFIWRNKDKATLFKTLVELRDFCKINDREFYISNDFKLANKINNKKTIFIFLSSRKVYKAKSNIKETDKLSPKSNYSKNNEIGKFILRNRHQRIPKHMKYNNIKYTQHVPISVRNLSRCEKLSHFYTFWK